ncbi:ribonuclease P protein component [Paenibacillus thermotolerans]|uniref:ribonuclease P protein component n=1 Tax=Paenibacillus thermotolerans TaxID=3027807 RepID=UPI0023682133|nr:MULTISPECIES: ribonuclease P protein component [unclassified Paenibacillus]
MQKRLRLRKREDFSRVFKHGKAAANHQLVVYVKPSKDAESFRVGISASKKIGNAVVRNKMRRRLKEILRGMETRIAKNVDIVVIVRKPAVELEFSDLKRSVHHVLKRAGVLSPPPRDER